MMKFALIIDKILHESFNIIDGKSYKMKTDEPYKFHSSIENETGFGIISWPFAYKGDFINLEEWGELPKNDYDVIMLVIERHFDKYNVNYIRKAYPNAIILGTMKENSNLIQHYNRLVNVYNDCDAVIFPFYNTPFKLIPNVKVDVHKPIFSIPQPYDIEYLYNKFYREERTETIFSYVAQHPPRRANTEGFSNYLGKKYNIPVIRQEVEYYPGRNQWHDFLNLFTKSTFNINLDPELCQGHQGVHCALFGIVNIGGINDSHYYLWPETATNDERVLEQKFKEYINNMQKRIEVITNAWERANELYSFESARKRLAEILSEIRK